MFFLFNTGIHAPEPIGARTGRFGAVRSTAPHRTKNFWNLRTAPHQHQKIYESIEPHRTSTKKIEKLAPGGSNESQP